MIILYSVVSIVALFFILQLSIVLGMRLKKGKPAPIVPGKAGKLMQRSENALFYFYSPACRACKDMTPMIKRLAQHNPAIVPIDVSQDMATAKKFGVMGTPATVVVKEGIIKEFLIGPQSQSKISALLRGQER